MNTPTTNPTTALSRWVHSSRMNRGLLGVMFSAALIVALLFVAMMAGCKEDEGGVVGVCDNTPPLAGSIAPACGAAGVALNQKISITFTEMMDSSTVTTSTFTLAGPSGSPVSGSITYVSATNIATFTPASSLAASTIYVYTVKGGSNGVKDMAGNGLANNFGCSFTTGAAPDITPPTVISTDPANSATGVPLSKVTSSGPDHSGPGAKLNKASGTAAGKIITATFSEAMDPLTINSSTFTVTGPGVTPVTGLVAYAGISFAATFIPATNLAPNTTYTGTIKGGATGAKDLAGNALASNYVWSFTTGAAADIIPPTVIFTDPANNAIGVALNKKIAATFSEAMIGSTVNGTTFTLQQGATSVPGAVTYTGTTAVYSPSGNLAPNTVYTATLSTGAKDLAGNALASTYVWSFTTGATGDATPPTVISTDPANNATGVAFNKIISATFSEAVDPLTITSSTFTVTGPGVTPVTGLVTYAGPSFAATFMAANTLAPNTTYTGTITTGAKDLAGNALASNYVWTFTTGAAADITPPTVVLTDPVNNAIGVALNKKITATFSEAMNQSTVSATTFTLQQGTTSVPGAVTYTGATAQFSPTGTLAPNTVYTATITTGAKDVAGNALASNYVWSFTSGAALDLSPPTVISTNPANNATGVPLSKVSSGSARSGPGVQLSKTSGAAVGKIITATFSEAMDPLTLASTTFTVTGPGLTPVTGLVTYAGASFTATFISVNILAPNTTYTGTITTGAKDVAGNALASNYVWTFTTGAALDITPPTVISTDPVNNAIGVALNKKLAATFSEAMNGATINATTFTLKQGTTAILGGVTYTGTTATFTPASGLTPSTAYTASIGTGAKDTTGNALASAYVWNFTTGAAADTTRPTVLSTDPANNATGVAVNKKIAATFSEAMDPSTISITTFTVRQGATPVPGAVISAGTTANFTPTSPLAANTIYTATLSIGVKDLAGNALASNYVWSFTTAAAADVLPPTVISTDPANNATGVALNKIITATFSESMDQSTITTATVTVTGLGGAPVTGLVSYASGANTVTFTLSSNLAANTTYTGTIKGGITGAKDLAGNALASDYVWSFTTGAPVGPPGQALVNLGTAARFAILSNSAITNIPSSAITGDVGISPGARSSITGLTLPEVTGTIFAADDAIPTPAMLIAAKNDAEAAYLDAVAAVRGTPTPISGNINGLTLVPGLYQSGTSIEISPGGFLYLDAQGDANAVFVIRSATSITTQSTSEVVLTGSAQAKNIFWVAGSAVTLGTNSKMQGTIIASTSISLLTGARLDGRALIQSAAAGQVSMDQNIIVRPPL